MKMTTWFFSAVTALGLLAGGAQAATYNVFVTAASTVNPNTGLQVVPHKLSNGGGQLFTGATYAVGELTNPGDSVTLDIFRLATYETALDADDLVPKPITATFDFGGAIGSITLAGTTAGVLGPVPGALATFISDTIQISPTLAIVISLANTTFATDGTQYVSGNGARGTVTATFTLAAVPLPATAPLALLALGGLAVAGRRRKAA